MNIEIEWAKAKQHINHNDGRLCFFAGILCLMTEMSKPQMEIFEFLHISKQIESVFSRDPSAPRDKDETSTTDKPN